VIGDLALAGDHDHGARDLLVLDLLVEGVGDLGEPLRGQADLLGLRRG